MSTTPASGEPVGSEGTAAASVPARMGFHTGMIVMEVGGDDDVDNELLDQIEELTGEELVGEGSDEVVDCVLLWFRDGDGDLTDALVDAISPLAENGFIWLLTPKRGRGEYVEPSEIAEAAATAGLSQTSLVTVGPDWAAARLVGRKSRSTAR